MNDVGSGLSGTWDAKGVLEQNPAQTIHYRLQVQHTTPFKKVFSSKRQSSAFGTI